MTMTLDQAQWSPRMSLAQILRKRMSGIYCPGQSAVPMLLFWIRSTLIVQMVLLIISNSTRSKITLLYATFKIVIFAHNVKFSQANNQNFFILVYFMHSSFRVSIPYLPLRSATCQMKYLNPHT